MPELKKFCTGCNRTLTANSFPLAYGRGAYYLRAKCFECMRSYYKSYEKRRRRKNQKQGAKV